MNLSIAIIAIFGCSVLSGVAPVLQKIGAENKESNRRIDLLILFKLIKDKMYVYGTGLQAVSWILALIALRILPLFLVQAIIAAGIIFTALIEKKLFHQYFKKEMYWSILLVLIGLAMLSFTARPSRAELLNQNIKLGIEVTPLIIAILGGISLRLPQKASAICLGLLGGLAFGATSLVGRVIVYPNPFWKIINNPMLWVLIIYGIVGQYLMTVALQRASSTMTNAVMIITGTIAPSVFGILYFKDVIRSGLYALLIAGYIILLIGTIAIIKVEHKLEHRLNTKIKKSL